jgi:hypothetical protein
MGLSRRLPHAGAGPNRPAEDGSRRSSTKLGNAMDEAELKAAL